MKKIYTVIMFFILFLVLVSVKVKAADNRVSTEFNNTISATYTGTITRGITIVSKIYDDTGRAFCTRFKDDAPEETCSAILWAGDSASSTANRRIAVAVGAMISKARSLSSGTPGHIDEDPYFYGEMAINHFLYTYNGKKSVNDVSSLDGWGDISKNSYYKSIYSAGVTAYKNYGKTSVEFTNQKISLSADGKTITGSATLRCYNAKGNSVGCSAQVKQTLTLSLPTTNGTVTKKVDAKYSRVNSPDIHYDYTYTYNLADNENLVADQKVTATFATTNKVVYKVAQNYDCGSKYQTLTPNAIMNITLTDTTSKKASLSVDRKDECSLTINKKDQDNNALKGAKFKLCSDQACTNEVDSGTSNTNGVVKFDGLSAGTYYLKEVQAPSGYDGSNEVKTIVFNANAQNDCVDSNTVNILNTKKTGKLKISKVDESGNPVVGAIIRVFTTSSNENVLENLAERTEMDEQYDFMENSGYDFKYVLDSNTGNDYFVTTTNPIEINDLTVGETYYIYEESTPENSDYAIKIGSEAVEISEAITYNVNLVNVHSRFKISKQDITNKKELPGAVIQILDSRGIKIEEWTSTAEPKEILGLEDGNYTLVEITAPKGYKQAESIKFTIENGKLKDDEDNTLVMYDDILKVEVPNTLSAKSMFFIFIGMLIISTGIGIFLYGVRKKFNLR